MYKKANQKLIGLALAALFSTPLAAADLVVNVGTIAKAKGQMMVALYNSAESFRKTVVEAAAVPATTGEMQFTFTNLDAGDYAVLVYHDVNDNGELDSNLLGMPKEPWGASLEGKKIFGAPSWSKTRFSVDDNGKSVNIKLK